MIKLSKRSTVYFDKEIHRILKIKAAETSRSISEIIDEAIRRELLEDMQDLNDFKKREKEATVSYEDMLKELKRAKKI